ncbi:WD40 repeat domain-containing protein [Corallococcus terminator]
MAQAFSADSRRLVTVGDSTARVWNLEDGRELLALRGDSQAVNAVLYLPDERIVTASDGGTVRLWDARSGAELRCWGGLGQAVRSLALSLDGRTLLAGTQQPASFVVFDLERGEEVHRVQLEAGFGAAESLVFSPDGGSLLVLENSNEPLRLSVFDTADWSPRWSVEGDAECSPPWVCFTPDGAFIRCKQTRYGLKRILRTYDARTGVCVDEVGQSSFSSASQLLPDGRQVRILNQRLLFTRGEALDEWVWLQSLYGCAGWRFAISPDGRWASFARRETWALLLVDLQTRRDVLGPAHRHDVDQLTFSSDGRHLLTSSLDGTVRVWDRDSGREVGRESLSPGWPSVRVKGGRAFALLPQHDGKRLSVLLGGADVELQESCSEHSSTVWSDDMGMVAERESLFEHRWLRVIDTRTGRALWWMDLAPEDLELCALSRSGRLGVISRGCPPFAKNTVELRLVDLKKDECLSSVHVSKGNRFRALTPDDKWLVLQKEYGTVLLVELESPHRQVRLEVPDPTFAVTCSPDGLFIATGDIAGRVRVWHREGKLLATLEGHARAVGALAFSEDGAFLASGGQDAVALIWPRSAWTQSSADSEVTMPSASA